MGLRFTDFGKQYGNKQLLKEVNIELPDLGCVFLMGQNGSGKTSLIKCICALEHWTGTIDGVSETVVVWDDAPFYEQVSGYRNLLILSAGRAARKQVFRAAQEMLPSELLKKPVSTYSYGQRKKLALVLAEILPGRLLILDEISNGLDYLSALDVKERIRKWSRDKCVLMTGHQYGFYDGITEKILVIRNQSMMWADGENGGERLRLEQIYEKEFVIDHDR